MSSHRTDSRPSSSAVNVYQAPFCIAHHDEQEFGMAAVANLAGTELCAPVSLAHPAPGTGHWFRYNARPRLEGPGYVIGSMGQAADMHVPHINPRHLRIRHNLGETTVSLQILWGCPPVVVLVYAPRDDAGPFDEAPLYQFWGGCVLGTHLSAVMQRISTSLGQTEGDYLVANIPERHLAQVYVPCGSADDRLERITLTVPMVYEHHFARYKRQQEDFDGDVEYAGGREEDTYSSRRRTCYFD